MNLTKGNLSALILAVVGISSQLGDLYNSIVAAYGQCSAAIAPVIALGAAVVVGIQSSPLFKKEQ